MSNIDPSTIDLSSLTVAQLVELRERTLSVEEDKKGAEKTAFFDTCKAQMKSLGITNKEMIEALDLKKTSGGRAVFVNPKDPKDTYRGGPNTPKWYSDVKDDNEKLLALAESSLNHLSGTDKENNERYIKSKKEKIAKDKKKKSK